MHTRITRATGTAGAAIPSCAMPSHPPHRSRRGAVVLGDLIGKVDLLRVACDQCARSGQYRVLRLIAEHGEEMALPDLLRIIAADCPENRGSLNNSHCQAYYPDYREHQKLLR
jgi:predicted secreted protein